MKYLEPQVVVIDDVKNEIQGILEYFNKKGLGCKWFNASYSDDDSDEMPSQVFSDVNLVFLDLYYSERFDAEQCSNWVRSIVPPKSFFILVLWTRDQSKAQEVIELLNIHNIFPFTHFIKSKSDFQITGQNKYDFSKLFCEINSEIEKFSSLDEIFIWKNSLKFSANSILGCLTKVSDPALFTNKLKKIIISHGGKAIKNDNNLKRKRSILFEALDTILIANTNTDFFNTPSPQNNEDLYDLSKIEDPIIDKELNSWFHFKLNKNISENLIVPGLITEFKDNKWKEMYSIHDDPIVIEYLKKQVGENVIIKSIAMVLSRPCDVAQQKFGKNIKLLSGIKIVHPIRKSNEKDFSGGSSKPDSIKLYDHLFINEDEKDVCVIFDYRYSFAIPESIFNAEFEKIKIFNKELLSEIQVEYSSYSSRLGITTII